MGTGRKFTKTVMTRPVKSAGARKRRQRVHRERLIALGVDEKIVSKMDPKAVRDLLNRPAKIKAGV